MEKLISMKQAAAMLGVGRASLYRLREFDESMPRAVELSPRRVAFRLSELEAWIASRPVAEKGPGFEKRQERGLKAAASRGNCK